MGGHLGERAVLDDPARPRGWPPGRRARRRRRGRGSPGRACRRTLEVVAQVAAHRAAGAGVERGERLVEEQQPRVRWPGPGRGRPAGPGRPTELRGRWSAWSARPTRSSHRSRRRRASAFAGPGPGARRPRSRARRCGGTAGSPGTPHRPGGARERRTRRSPGRRRTTSSIAIRPASIGSSPARHRSIVLLPAPLGPSSATHLAGLHVEVDVEVERAEPQPDAQPRASRASPRPAASTRAEPAVAQGDEHGERHDDQHQAEHDRFAAGFVSRAR